MGAARHAYSLLTRLLAAVLAVSVAVLPAFAQSPAPAPVRVMVLPFQVHSARSLAYLEQSLADLADDPPRGFRAHRGRRGRRRDARRFKGATRHRARCCATSRANGGARFVVTGSLTELAGQYSLDLRVAPVAGGAASTLDAAAAGDDQLLDRVGDLAARSPRSWAGVARARASRASP